MKFVSDGVEVKPCPFCGNPVHFSTMKDNRIAHIECRQCGAMGPEANDVQTAIREWNKREEDRRSQ